MGVYINMEMPKGIEMLVVFSDGTVHKCLPGIREYIKKGTAIPVLPHGDLIDANKLAELCDIMADKCGSVASIWHQFKTTVEWSPIVIPAEGHMDTDFWGEEYAEAKGLAEEDE